MSNIDQLRREGQAARLTWDFGAETLPLRSDDPISVAAERVRDIEAFTVRCPRCRIPMGNDGRYLCVACSGGEAARYEP